MMTTIEGEDVEIILEDSDNSQYVTVLVDGDFYVSDSPDLNLTVDGNVYSGTFELQVRNVQNELILIRNGSFTVDSSLVIF